MKTSSFSIRPVYCAFLLWCLLRVTEASHCLPPESLEPAAERLTEYRCNFSRQERALRSISFHKGDNSILLEWRKSITTCGCKSSKSTTDNGGCEDILLNRLTKLISTCRCRHLSCGNVVICSLCNDRTSSPRTTTKIL